MKLHLVVSVLLFLTAGFTCLFAAVTSAKLENSRVKISEVTYDPGVPRERYIRATDQVIVFLDDCRYERIDSESHAKEVRKRKSADVIWHNKGEDAPVLTNLGTKPYRTLVIELK